MPYSSEQNFTRRRYILVAAIVTMILLGFWSICLVERQNKLINSQPLVANNRPEELTSEKRSYPSFLWTTLYFDVEAHVVRFVMSLRFRTHGNFHSVTVERDGPREDPIV